MTSLWALLSTLALSSAVAASGVAVGATTTADTEETAAVERWQSPRALTEVPALVPTSAPDGLYLLLATPQDVVPGTRFLAHKTRHKASRETRSDRHFYKISSTGKNDVPSTALDAYKRAAKVMATADPDCRISWTLLAAIGRVETNHGRFGGAQLGTDGISRPEIRGPQLDGAGPFAAIRDSDDGVLDRDPVWDRAVGPMQFLPQTWLSVARDADGDGKKNPDDIDDSALGAAVYLCQAGGSLADSAGIARAAFRYNHSDYYVDLVLSFVSGYQTGVFALPSPPPPAAEASASARVKARGIARAEALAAAKAKVKAQKTASKPAPSTPLPIKPSPKPSPKPTHKPSPKPTPKPTPSSAPSPKGPTLVQVSGGWSRCGGGFCLGSTNLELGSTGTLGEQASSDFDGDGTIETNADEFTGLVGRHVSVQGARTSGGLVVFVIDGKGYRNADGSFARTVSGTGAAAGSTP